MQRVISFEQARTQYPHRFTLEHVPAWASRPVDMTINGKGPCYHAPQFRSDREWYEHTLFPGEAHVGKREKYCYTSGQTWPVGVWIFQPYRRA